MAKSWLGRMKEVGNLRGPLDWLRIAADGNLWVTIFEKGPTGKLVGEDYHGNRYYEDTATTYNRKRWVVYKDMTNYNPSEIPPGARCWLCGSCCCSWQKPAMHAWIAHMHGPRASTPASCTRTHTRTHKHAARPHHSLLPGCPAAALLLASPPPPLPPAEWHGWLNYINDFDPANHKFKQPIYAIEASVTKTGTRDAYGPKGSWGSADKRNWLKYQAWAPPQAK